MIDEVNNGSGPSYDFYTQEETAGTNGRKNTGLFFSGKTRSAFRGHFAGWKLFVCRLHPRRLPVCRGDQQAGIQRDRAEIPIRAWRRGCDARSRGGRSPTCFQHADESWCRGPRAIRLWGSSAGARMAGRNRLARGRKFRRGQPSQTVGSGDGLHWPFGVLRPRAAHFRRRWRAGRIALPRSWKGESPRCARPAQQSNSHRYAASVTNFGPGTGRSAEGWLKRAIRFWERSTHRGP